MELLLLTLIILLIIISLLSLFYVLPRFSGAVFQPTESEKIAKIIRLAEPGQKDIALDLGSGDGRIVIAFAKQGIESHGFEINPLLVLFSRWKIKKQGLDNAHIHWKNFWKQDFSKYSIITLFQTGKIMDSLKGKLQKESNARILSYYWKFPGWRPVKNIEDVYLYVIKKQ
jgi:hypothetical protein